MTRHAPRFPSAAGDGLQRWMGETLGDLGADCAILAVGCEQAFFAPHLLEYASHVTVLDTSRDQIAQLAPRFPEIGFRPHHPTSPLPFRRETFDAVWCGDLLDRVFDPAAALREMHRVLAIDGRLLASVPDGGAMRKVWRTLLGRGEAATAIPRVRCFTRSALARSAREAGFVEIEIGSVRVVDAAKNGPARKLLLRARKERSAEPVPMSDRAGVVEPVEFFTEELAFAGRTAA